MNGLRVHSIFPSFSGEVGAIPQGSRVVFIRFQGCNFRCSYCDAPEALNPSRGRAMSPQEICDAVRRLSPEASIPPVIITGGEPLVQDPEAFRVVVEALRDTGNPIQIETNGSRPVPHSMDGVFWVVDYKMPGAGPLTWALPEMIAAFPAGSYVKFVCNCSEDLDHVPLAIRSIEDACDLPGFVYAVSGTENFPPSKIAPKLLGMDLGGITPVLNVQIHKLVNMP